MKRPQFDHLGRRAGNSVRRRSVLGWLAGAPLGIGTLVVPEEVRARRKAKKFCLDGATVKAKGKRKIKNLRRRGASRGACRTCVPRCPAIGCGANDGCGGTCGCPTGRVCAVGTCEPCTVTCIGSPATCRTDLTTALAAGGNVYVCPGRYEGSFTIATSLQVYGAGNGEDAAANTILDGLNLGPVITISGVITVGFTGLRITNGSTPTDGGGISQPGDGTLSVTNCVIAGNEASNNGAGIFAQGTLSIRNSQVTGNAATNSGSGIYLTPVTSLASTITNSVISGNSNAFGPGGGILVAGTSLVIASTEISNNTASDGGGVYFNGSIGQSVAIDGASRIMNNIANGSSPTGGGLARIGLGSITVASGATVSGNTVPQCSVGVTGC